MAEFKNHRRFTLRCLSKGLIPVSIKLKTKVQTPKGNQIIRKAERMLMNERVRSINNTIIMLNHQADTCINTLESTLNKDVMEKCHDFINHIRERRRFKTMERQKKKFEKLWLKKTGGHSNIQNGRDGRIQNLNGTDETIQSTDTAEAGTTRTPVHNNNNNKVKWVHNLSKTPLTEVQEKVLAHGPNFAIATKDPPVIEYISQIERICQQLGKGKAEELRGEIKQILKKTQLPKPNITKEEAKAIKELRRNKERVIFNS